MISNFFLCKGIFCHPQISGFGGRSKYDDIGKLERVVRLAITYIFALFFYLLYKLLPELCAFNTREIVTIFVKHDVSL